MDTFAVNLKLEESSQMSLPNVATGDPHVFAHNLERQTINDLQEALEGIDTHTAEVVEAAIEGQGILTRPDDELMDVDDTLYYRARVDSSRRLAEDALLADGTIPGWITDRIVVRSGLGRWPLRWITVAQDGSGDFTTLSAAAQSVTDSSWRNPMGIIVRRGTYYERSVVQKDGLWWIGVDREQCIVRGELPATATDAEIDPTSTFDFDFGGVLANLTITAKNMRYAVHADAKANHVDAEIHILNCHLEHFGNDEVRAWRDANPASGRTSSTVWTNERPWGFGSSSGQDVLFEDSSLIGGDPFTVHDFDDWDRPARVTLINTKAIGWKEAAVLSLSNFGAGHPSILSFRGCQIALSHVSLSDTSFRSKLAANQLSDSNDYTLTIAGGSHEPIGLLTNIVARALKIESASSAAPSSVEVSGTAADVIFGLAPQVRPGGYGLKGYVYGRWDISGRLTGNFGIDQVDNTLGRRLGNCATTPKTLTVTVNGAAPVNIVFNTNLTAETNVNIIATINTALAGAAVASEYDAVTNEWFPDILNDTLTAPNKGAEGIPRFHAVKRSGRGIQIMGVADDPKYFLGISLERMLPGKPGRVLTRGRLYSLASGVKQIPGITTTVTAGQSIYHSDSTPGQFSTSGTRLAMAGYLANWAEFQGQGAR